MLDQVSRTGDQVVEVLHFMGGEDSPRRVFCHLCGVTLGVTWLAGWQAGPSERLEACMLCALTFRAGLGFQSL